MDSIAKDVAALKKSVLEELGLPQSRRLIPDPRPTLTRGSNPPFPTAAGDSPGSTGQEVDVWYGSYNGWSMLPDFVLTVMGTLILMGLHYRHLTGYGPRTQMAFDHLTWGLLGGMWLCLIFRWGYRKLWMRVRLTSKRLLLDSGWLYPAHPTIQLAQVARVEKQQNLLEHTLKVGRVQLLGERAETLGTLSGLAEPERVVALIKEQVEKARQGEVSSAKLGITL
jgi:hypothetical protein